VLHTIQRLLVCQPGLDLFVVNCWVAFSGALILVECESMN
jgi:hypothetical protein